MHCGFKSYTDVLSEIYGTYTDAKDDTKSIKHSVDLLEEILVSNDVSPCHGIIHAKVVMYHAFNALEATDFAISLEEKSVILLAALLHDADDGKFFPKHTNYENLRKILADSGKTPDFIEQVVYIVSIVSASKNGDNVPPEVKGKEWMLIPRYADRLEAIGLVGIDRCLTYTSNKGMPLYNTSTPRPTTEEEIWKYATEERYSLYTNGGKSMSMIDHYYDKLLRLSVFPIENEYFKEQCEIRRKPLIDFLIWFGESGDIVKEDVERYLIDRGYVSQC